MILAPPTRRWTPLRNHPQQIALWRSPKRFNLAEGGRRSGKTELAKRKGSVAAWSQTQFDDYLVAFCAPVRDQARGIYWDDLKRMQPPEFVDDISETHLEIKLINGSTIAVVGMDKPQRIEGKPLDWAFVDEFADMKPEAWDRNIRPALDTEGRDGRAWVYGVPRPSVQFRRLAELARKDPDWAYFNWKSSSVMSKERIEAAKRTIDPLTFAQEYDAQRVSFDGRAYYCFEMPVHGQPRVYERFYNPLAPLLVALDFNVDPGVAAIGQEIEHPELGLIDAWMGQVWIERGSNSPAVARKIIADWGKHEGWVYMDGDATGGRRSTQNEQGGGDWAQIDPMMRAAFPGRYANYTPRSNPPERDRVNAMNARLRSTDGKVHTLIDQDRCDKILRDFDEVQLLKGGSGELDKDRKRFPDLTDISDAIGYSVVRRHPLIEVVSAWEAA